MGLDVSDRPDPRVEVQPDAGALATAVAGELLTRLADAQRDGREPHVVLTGGTIAARVHRELARLSQYSDVDWTRVVVWWGDERFVGPGSQDRNAVPALSDLLGPVGATQVHQVPSTDDVADVDAAAASYEDSLAAHGVDRFDVVMLGVGPDGHVASLFPGHAALAVQRRVAVGVTDSPKPPPERVSLTFKTLSRTRSVWLVASGEDKAGAVAAALAPGGTVEVTPARGVRGEQETVWFVDAAAASRT